ncbi:uncharacterized protein VP01_1562g3 [Puccinia sorghi]|uniref:Protein CPL1-like domain-containing protein n=1 Tax=Puccinia sorghi TaxID=27349 RepID=A0A0L6VI54_9BASI|nr:uncharacterized protein VP01_1562g3 [Puccinia sorghi]
MKNLARALIPAAFLSVLSGSQLYASLLERTPRQSFNLRTNVGLEDQGCPVPLRACAILDIDRSLDLHVAVSKRTITKRTWECSNLQTDVNSCGSCDNDCMELPNVARAKCDSGSCKISESRCSPQTRLQYSCFFLSIWPPSEGGSQPYHRCEEHKMRLMSRRVHTPSKTGSTPAKCL